MANLTPPSRLPEAGTIALVSPSSATPSITPIRLSRSIAFLESKGFRVVALPSVTTPCDPGPANAAARADELNSAFANPHVNAIISCVGGWASHQLLPHLDYDLIGRNAKPFIGYSDTTALHMAMYQLAGLSTFYGPAALPQWGEFDGPDDYTWASFEDAVVLDKARGVIDIPDHWTTEVLPWDTDDIRARRRSPAPAVNSLRAGSAVGPVLAANLDTLVTLAGTPWWPDITGHILLVEASDTTRPTTLYRALAQLSQAPGFAHILGLGFGRVPPSVHAPSIVLDEYLRSLMDHLPTSAAPHHEGVPVAVNLPFGHTDPMMTIRQGALGRLTCAESGHVQLVLASLS